MKIQNDFLIFEELEETCPVKIINSFTGDFRLCYKDTYMKSKEGFDNFWDFYYLEKGFNFEEQYEETKRHLRNLIKRNDLEIKGISQKSLERFLRNVNVTEILVAKILDFFNYEINVEIIEGPLIKGKFLDVRKRANDFIRGKTAHTIYFISKKTKINYAQIHRWEKGEMLPFHQLNKIRKLKIFL